MKKSIALLILISLFSLNSSLVTYAHTHDLDIYEAFENHGSIMIITDAQTGNILHGNRAASDFYGYTIEQLETMKLEDLNVLTSEETKNFMERIENNNKHEFIIDHKLANGEVKTVEIKSYPYVSGNKTYLIGIVNDISTTIYHEKIERALFYSLIVVIILLLVAVLFIYKNLRRLKTQRNEISSFNELRIAFLNSYDNMIYLKDEKLRYIFVNKELEKFFDKKETHIVGQIDYDLTDKEFADKQNKSDLLVLNRMNIVTDEICYNNRIYKATKFPVKVSNGKYGVGAYIEDVTVEYNHIRIKDKILLRNQILVDVLSSKYNSTKEQLDYALNESLKLTESKFGYIYLYNEERREFTLNSWSKDVMPECEIVEKLTKYQLEKTGLWGEVVRDRKPIIVNDYEMPNPMKRGYPKGHVKLTKFMSVPIIIDDEIVAVVGLANKEYDYDSIDSFQVTALMNGIWNAKERRELLEKYEVERNKFKQTLVSIGDGVIVVDMDGNVTMLNMVAEQLTGWTNTEAQGRHYKEVFDLSHEDPKSSINDPIKGVLSTDTICELGNHAILTSKEGKKYSIKDSAAPIKDNKNYTNGVVLVFRDVTDKKAQRDRIKYLYTHDSLTKLYNRMYFDKEIKRLDIESNLPISIIVGDVNGLKLTNDIFGHNEGDKLLKRVAEVQRRILKDSAIIARVGGDEFNIILPKTSQDEANELIIKIRKQLHKDKVKAIRCSISMGCDTKVNINTEIKQILRNAEAKMYSVKTLDREEVNSTTINTIIKDLHNSSPREEKHSINVSKSCEDIGKLMNLPVDEIRKVKEAGYLHDIGKIILKEDILNKKSALTKQETKEMQEHPIVGYRILNSFDNTMDLAEIILAHHERWDGSGYPKGLKGEEIPVLARIIAVAERYDALLEIMSGEKIIDEIKKQSGIKFDPQIVITFIRMLKKGIK